MTQSHGVNLSTTVLQGQHWFVPILILFTEKAVIVATTMKPK